MGGKKTKITMEKITKKDSRSVTFSKRRNGLFSKASQLCLLSGAQVAILATPVSSKSNKSFYSFGHSSVDGVVSAFLANQRPQEDLGQRFWWEDESLAKSENTEELSDAIDSISSMLRNLKADAMENREDMKKKKKDVVIHETHQELDREQTLNLQPSCASICIRDDPPANFEGFVSNSGAEDQIVAIPDMDKLDGSNQELDLDLIVDFETNPQGITMDLKTGEISTNRTSCSGSEAAEDGAMVIHSDSGDQFSGSDENQVVAFSDNSNNDSNALTRDLRGCNQELDVDHMIGFLTSSDSEGLLSMNFERDDVSMMMNTNQNMCYDSGAVDDGSERVHRGLHEDNNLHLSDYFDDLASIAAL